MIKRDELIDDINIEELVDSLGIPKRIKGNNFDILCPNHNDNNFGSCKIYLNKKNARCFVCAKTFSIFDLTMAALNCSYYEAVKHCQEIAGGQYIDDDDDVKKEIFPLSKEALACLELAEGESLELKKDFRTDKKMYYKKLKYFVERQCSKIKKIGKWLEEDTSSWLSIRLLKKIYGTIPVEIREQKKPELKIKLGVTEDENLPF